MSMKVKKVVIVLSAVLLLLVYTSFVKIEQYYGVGDVIIFPIICGRELHVYTNLKTGEIHYMKLHIIEQEKTNIE